ncbi:HAD family phosphatase [Arthrobacter sp. zg-ZUI100]|uniref:HAD family hydrolase n=1 Tax=Arthrobacter jiangjiafuii TaxID=2817475 RepID=UPI001AED4BDC|nr:HAD family phosphatase [Arthrobacter jiangjiafuii]MBP3036883.1 HAD family phosphatase [Arthrobacter jiangjiafuii]
MTGLARPGLWYLFDYGMVISAAPEPRDWLALQRATGLDLDLQAASSPYWMHREGFDAGTLTPSQYWSAVLGRTAGADEVRRLEALDAAQWAHLNPGTLAVLETLSGEDAQLALLSNMPAAMSRHYTATAQWPALFSRLYFSGQLRMLKPDPRIFEYVAGDLGVQPRDIVFIDDNAANISAAQALGLQTVHHTGDTDLRAELAEVPR